MEERNDLWRPTLLPAHQKAHALTADHTAGSPWQLDAGRLGSGCRGYAAFSRASLMLRSRTCDAQLTESSCEMLVATGVSGVGLTPDQWLGAWLPLALRRQAVSLLALSLELSCSPAPAPGDMFQAPRPKSPEQKATSQGLCVVKSRHLQTAA